MGDFTTLSNDIKNHTFKNAYLLYGEEDFLKNQKKRELLNALADPADTMNFASYEGKNFVMSELVGLAKTMPFFAEHRTILVENSGLFDSRKKAEEGEEEDNNSASDDASLLVSLLEELPETTYLIFVEQKINRVTKTYKAIKKCGDDVEFLRQEAPALKAWIKNTLHKEGYIMDGPAFHLFWQKVGDDRTGVDRDKKQKTGNDMLTISSELEKLICYCADTKTITEKDVEEMVTERIEEQAFVMTAAIARKDRKEAFDRYYELLALQKEPLVILGSVRWQIETLYHLKDLLERGMTAGEAAGKLKMNPYAAENNAKLCRYFTLKELENVLIDCVDTETAIKTGRMDMRMAVEVLIVKCVSR